MRFIDFSSFTPSAAWQNNARKAAKELEKCRTHSDRLQYIKANSLVWRSLKGELMTAFGNRCWFTDAEETVAQLDVEHFRPKAEALEQDQTVYEGYWYLAFELSNLRLAGQIPNRQHKRCYFPLKPGSRRACGGNRHWQEEIPIFLDPIKLTDVELVGYNDSGEMCPSPAAENQEDKDRVRITNDILGLSAHQPLVEARQRVWSSCRQIMQDIERLMEERRQFGDTSRIKGERERLLKELWKKTRPTEPFASVARSCIEMSGLRWAQKLLAT